PPADTLPRSGGFAAAFLDPLRDLATRPAIGGIVAFALLYKFGDAIAGTMAMPFYRELGFSGGEIATASNLLGVAASAVGVVVGGAVIGRIGILRGLAVGGVLQAVTNLLFAALAVRGRDFPWRAPAAGGDPRPHRLPAGAGGRRRAAGGDQSALRRARCARPRLRLARARGRQRLDGGR